MDKGKEKDLRDKRSKSKGKYKKPYRKDSYRKDSKDGVKEEGTPINDYGWYAPSENIGRSVGSIPYNVFAGTYEWYYGSMVNGTVTAPGTESLYLSTTSRMGVCALDYIPVPGYSADASSGVNIAMRAIYSYVRHMNSGSSNYEAVDLMLYLLAMEQIYIMINEAKRIYRCATVFYPTNRNVPQLLVRANDPASAGNGQLYQSVQENLAQFRAGINLIVHKVRALCVPAILDVFKRHAVLASSVISDSSTVRGQFYEFVARGFFYYDPTGTTGGQLVYQQKESTNWGSYSQILNTINSYLNILIEDEDSNIMSGDILKAYGNSNLYTIPELEDNEQQEFVYDEDLLNQIQNARFIPTTMLQNYATVTQINGYLIYQPKLASSLTSTTSTWGLPVIAAKTGYHFNSHKDDPEWKDTLEWSRCMTVPQSGAAIVWSYDASTGYTATITGDITCGTELMLTMTLYNMAYTANGEAIFDSEDNVIVNSSVYGNAAVSTSSASVAAIANYSGLGFMMRLNEFDWHPAMDYYFYSTSSTSTDIATYTYMGTSWDFRYYTVISQDTIHRLHDVAILGEYKTDLVTKGSK